MLKWLALAASCLAFTCALAGATDSRASASATSDEICDAIQSPTLATAVTALTALLPSAYQPSKKFKVVVGAAVAACHNVVKLAATVGQALVRDSAPAAPPAQVFPPYPSLVAGRTMNIRTGETDVFVSWAGLGVIGYEEQTATGSGLDPAVYVYGSSPSVWRPIAPGGVYQFYVRGVDLTKRPRTGWARSQRFTLRAIDSMTPNSGGWRTETGKTAYNGTLVSNASAQTTDLVYDVPNGVGVALVAPLYPNGGVANIYVDGSFAQRINLYWPTVIPGRLVFSWSWPAGGSHHVTVRRVQGEFAADALLVLAPTT